MRRSKLSDAKSLYYSKITPEELALHNKRDDAWICIRGNVYNVTEYLAFHPGGIDEIMRGIGIPNATELFDEVHPWVNYDKILTNYYIGRLGVMSYQNIPETGGVHFQSPQESREMDQRSTITEPITRTTPVANNLDFNVKHEWLERQDFVMITFVMDPYSNPFFEIRHPIFETRWFFVVSFVETVFTFQYTPYGRLREPPIFKLFHDIGRVEVGFEKIERKMWEQSGNFELYKRKVISQQDKRKYLITAQVILNKHTFMMSLQKTDKSLCNTPLGHHIMLYNDVNTGREYTPVPHYFLQQDKVDYDKNSTSPMLTLVIRRYPDGRLSNYLYNKKVGDTVLGSEPMGYFDLQMISTFQYFLFLSGGVGITAFLAIIDFLLEKKHIPAKLIMLVNFNQTPQHQFLMNNFQAMTEDLRFMFVPILTQPPSDYTGFSGHMSSDLLSALLISGFRKIKLSKIFFMCCGPSSFNSVCFDLIHHLGVPHTNLFFFAATNSHVKELVKERNSDSSSLQKTASQETPQWIRPLDLENETRRYQRSSLFRKKKHCACISAVAPFFQNVRKVVVNMFRGKKSSTKTSIV